MAERQILFDAISIRWIDLCRRAETAAMFGGFALEQMASPGARAHYLAGARDLESLGHGFSGLNSFGTSHKIYFLSKRARNIGCAPQGIKR